MATRQELLTWAGKTVTNVLFCMLVSIVTIQSALWVMSSVLSLVARSLLFENIQIFSYGAL